MVKKTFEKWKEESINIHGNKYEYINIERKNNNTYLNIICPIHGKFSQIARSHAQKGCGCMQCSKEKKRKNFNEWIKDGNKMHKNKYKYLNLFYKNNKPFLTIFCNKHNIEFNQNASNHCIIGQDCPKCGIENTIKNKKPTNKNKRITLQKWIERANKKHNNIYKYCNLEYIKDNRNKYEVYLNIICSKHGSFKQRAKEHCNGYKCPKCSNNGCSKKQIEWLNIKKIVDNTNIQHFYNDGEYLIKEIGKNGTKVDGFSKELNKVYEFHGDFWHGNPKKYKLNDLNNVCKKTYGELYNNTKERSKKIKELGYILEEIWSSKWNNHKRLLKEIKKLKLIT